MINPEKFYKDLLDNLYDGIYFVDLERQITYWNHGAERIAGYSADEVIGNRCMDNLLMHVDPNGETLCNTACPITKTIENNNCQEAEVFLHHKNGQRVPVIVRTSPILGTDGKVIGAVETFSDNSKMVLEREQINVLKDEVTKDALTGISNRKYMNMILKNSFNEFNEFGFKFGLLFIDIDNFKLVNDQFGHNTGDEILMMVAHTLDQNIRTSDYISRWGGEEFVGIIFNIDLYGLSLIAEKLRMLVEESHLSINDDNVGVTVSIGGALVRPGETMESIIDRADRLMFQCKSKGRNRILVSE